MVLNAQTDIVVYEMARARGRPFPTQAWDYYEMARATLAGYPSGCQRTPKQPYKLAWVTCNVSAGSARL